MFRALSVLTMTLVFSISAVSDTRPATRTFDVEFSAYPHTVYAQKASIDADDLNDIDSIGFVVASKPGSLSADIHVTYEQGYLANEALIDGANIISLPVFGLYENYENVVTIELTYKDGVELSSEYILATTPSMLDSPLPAITNNLPANKAPVDYLLIRTAPNAAIIIDADGETRWAIPRLGERAMAVHYDGRQFVVGSAVSSKMYQVGWDGEVSVSEISDPRYTLSHHMLEAGKTGIFNTVSYVDGAIDRPQSVMAEMSSEGAVIDSWDFDEILTKKILQHNEDPAALIQNGVDWFHMNSVIYDASDDSIIASSRENFVIKVDYKTKEIKWILGNPGKDWFSQFPNSLQPLALKVTGNPPIGQHALSVSKDGRYLTLFNNGWGNQNLADVGDTRGYSMVSVYEIDAKLQTANEVWSFDHQQQYFSPICSSAYRTAGGDMLITYSGDDSILGKFPGSTYPPKDDSNDVSHVLVVNDSQEVLYDITIDRRDQDMTACYTASITYPINLENFVIQ